MKYCSNCGASLGDGAASFCSECGYALRPCADSVAPPAAKEATTPPVEPVATRTVHKAPISPPPPPEEQAATVQPDTEIKQDKRRRQRKQKPPRPESPSEEVEVEREPTPTPDDGYDRYYEDILPIDEGQRKAEKFDPDMLKKVALVTGGALLLVIIAIVALVLM